MKRQIFLVCLFYCFFRLPIYESIAAIFWQSASYVFVFVEFSGPSDPFKSLHRFCVLFSIEVSINMRSLRKDSSKFYLPLSSPKWNFFFFGFLFSIFVVLHLFFVVFTVICKRLKNRGNAQLTHGIIYCLLDFVAILFYQVFFQIAVVLRSA